MQQINVQFLPAWDCMPHTLSHQHKFDYYLYFYSVHVTACTAENGTACPSSLSHSYIHSFFYVPAFKIIFMVSFVTPTI